MSRQSEPQITGLVFPHQTVIARRDHEPGEEQTVVTRVEYEIDKAPADPNMVIVDMKVWSNQDQSVNPPYEYDVAAFTMVSYDPNESPPLDEKDVKRAGVIGYRAAIGAIRDHIATMTSRAPWGVFYIGVADVEEDELQSPKQEA